MRSILSALLILGLAGPTAAEAAGVQPPAASLRVSNVHPRQLQGVVFDAVASTSAGQPQGYLFRYGDGIQEASYQPVMMHGYRTPGTYQATVAVTDSRGQTMVSKPVTVTVRDGRAPVVSISAPRSLESVRRRGRGYLFRGQAVDPGPGASGVRRVELALQFLSPPVGTRGCLWFDGRHSLVLRGCAQPLFFPASFGRGHWSFLLRSGLSFPSGFYALRVRAFDRAGNISDWYAPRLRTILGFKLL